ncbi:MAG: AbrB/MazE/SpoVT family DNA-binding domain-containing protein [Treponema sp.]|jgi:antitoxin MazE|nr:AbrB/MazE/SpoVT family DNA-binding domain-containing protein [Treponema sp.]
MLASVVQIGNSRGIRLPQNILRELKIEDKVEMTVHNDALIIKSVEKKPREGWNEVFAKMSKNKEDTLLLSENIDSEDFEWVW